MEAPIPIVQLKRRKFLYNSIQSNSSGDVTYYILVALAAVVATFGLLMNNTAVIIGAMLISPIMNPIIGISLSITLGDSKLFSKSIKSLILGSVLAVTVSVFVTMLIPTRSLTSEILSRSQPSIIDLLIALASGAAGAFTMCHNEDTSSLPGVAIATALMPPLCVVGSGMVLNDYKVALGGFLLFLANLIAINLASAVIFKMSGFTAKDEIAVTNADGSVTIRQYKYNRLLISIAAFIIISIPLTYFMYNTIHAEKIRNTIESSLKIAISTHEDVDLVNYSYEYRDNKYFINTVVRAVTSLRGKDIRNMENYLERRLNKPTEIKMKIIFATEIDALTTPDPDQSTPDIKPTPAPTEDGALSSGITTDKLIQYTIEEKCKLIHASLIAFSFSYESSLASYIINATISGDIKEIDSFKESAEITLEDKLNRKVQLKINAVAKPLPDQIPSSDATSVDPDNIYNTD